MQKKQIGHSAYNYGFMHQSETSQSRRLEKTTETYEISSRNPGIVFYIKGRQNNLSKMVYRRGIRGAFQF